MLVEPVALIRTGDELIDSQHAQLMDLLNLLLLGVEAQDKGRVATALQGLTRYTVEHFTDEEALHRACGMEGFAAHQAEHHRIIKDLDAFVHTYQHHPEAERELLPRLYDVVKDFMRQLETFDVPLATYLRTHRERGGTL